MCGYMTKADKIEWAERTRAAEAESAEQWKKDQEDKNGGKIVRHTRANAGRNGHVDYTSPPKRRPGSPSPAGRDLTQVSAKERAAHQKAMLDAHKERFKDAYWTQTVPIIEQQKTQDVFLESPGHRINGANKKFVVPTDRPTRSLAPKDVDDHLFTGIHRGAESEQMAINRMIRNDEIDFEKLHTQAK